MFLACLSVQTALVGNVVNDVRLWGLNFSGNVYMHRRLAFSMPHSSSYFQIVSIRLLSVVSCSQLSFFHGGGRRAARSSLHFIFNFTKVLLFFPRALAFVLPSASL